MLHPIVSAALRFVLLALGSIIAVLPALAADDAGALRYKSPPPQFGYSVPAAALTILPATGAEPLAIDADASGSLDPDGSIVSYTFDFGDGTIIGPQPAPYAKHTLSAGYWLVRVTVLDNRGLSGSTVVPVAVASPGGNYPPVAALALVPNSGAFGSALIDLVTDPSAVMPNPDEPRPDYLAPFSDPVFGTRVTRVTDDAPNGFDSPQGSGVWGTDARHHYMTDQPWNADGSLIAVENEAFPHQIFLDDQTYQVALLECPNYARRDDRWHPTLPNVRINVDDDQLTWFDVVNCVLLRSWTLPFVPQGLGDGAGNPSADGRYVALADSTRMFVVDMDPQPPYAPYPNVRIGPIYDFSTCSAPSCQLGWVSMSPSGKYVVLKYSGDYPQVFDMDPATLALTPRPMPESSPRCHGTAAEGYIYDIGHGDLGVDPFDDDEDVMVGQEHCGNRGAVVDGQLMGGVVMVRIRDGAVTSLTDPTNEAYPHHISLRNVDRPGWAYAGYYPEPGKRFSAEIIAVKMDGSQQVERLAHIHSATPGCYRCEAHAVPSRDGKRVMWASNWSIDCTTCGPTSEIKGYILDTRAPSPAEGPYDEPLTVTADASSSFDLDGEIVSYTFDFDDGTTVGPQSAPYATRTLIAGTRHVTVTVVDDQGDSHVATQTITVQGTDVAPDVVAPSAASVNAGETLELTVAALDPNGDAIDALAADLSALPPGNGAIFTAAPDHAAGTLTWIPAAVGGPYDVTFTASNALQGAATTSITVTASNLPPVAALAVTPLDGVDPSIIEADASASYDPDGSIVSYTFDFGDGTIIGPQAAPTATHTLGAGSWQVSVTVADDLDALDADVQPVVVYPNLVSNPSFEFNTVGWKENGGATIARVAGGYDGDWSLEMTGPAVIQTFGANDSPDWVSPVADSGAVYRFSAWVRSDSSTAPAEIKIREYLNGVKQGSTFRSDTVGLSTAWRQIVTDYVTRANGSDLDLTVAADPSITGEVFQVDMVQIGLVSVPASPGAGAARHRAEAGAASTEPAGDSPAKVTHTLEFSAGVSPNPVREHATLHLVTTRPGPLNVSVFDINGRRLAVLVDERRAPAGQHVYALTPRGLRGGRARAGVYFYRVRAAEGSLTGRFLVLE